MSKENTYSNMKCIWMNANVIDYKLCDRKFDCENCAFDKVMKNAFHDASNDERVSWTKDVHKKIHKLLANFQGIETDERLLLLKNHLSLKLINDNNYCIGFSPLLANLLDDYQVGLATSATSYSANQNFLNIYGEWGNIIVTTPIRIDFAEIIDSHNTQQSWFGIIKTDASEIEKRSITVSNYQKDMIFLTKELTQYSMGIPQIGATMLDGGIEAKYLYQILGKEKYLEILKSLVKS